MGTATAPEATESAAALAKKEGIELSDVKGTGAEGRIKVSDVETALEKRAKAEEKAKKAEAAEKQKAAEAKAEADASAAGEAAEAERDDAASKRDDRPDAEPDEQPTPQSKSRRRSSETMPSDGHLKGCPKDPDRIEFHDAEVPATVEGGPRIARMAHCVECGATVEIG